MAIFILFQSSYSAQFVQCLKVQDWVQIKEYSLKIKTADDVL